MQQTAFVWITLHNNFLLKPTFVPTHITSSSCLQLYVGGYSTPIYFRVCPKQGPGFSKPYDMVFMCCSFCLDIYIKLSHHNYSEYTLQFCAAQQSTINIIIRPTDVTCVHRASKSGTARESSWYSNTPSHRLFMHNKSNSHTISTFRSLLNEIYKQYALFNTSNQYGFQDNTTRECAVFWDNR